MHDLLLTACANCRRRDGGGQGLTAILVSERRKAGTHSGRLLPRGLSAGDQTNAPTDLLCMERTGRGGVGRREAQVVGESAGGGVDEELQPLPTDTMTEVGGGGGEAANIHSRQRHRSGVGRGAITGAVAVRGARGRSHQQSDGGDFLNVFLLLG